MESGAAMTRPICAVDFTTNSINILVQRRPDRIEATDAALPAEAIEDGKILQPVAVQLFLTKMLKELGVDKPEIRLCLSDSACVSRFLDYPQMPMKDLEQSLRFEAGRELPVSPRNAYLGWQVLDEQNARRRVLLVAAWRDVVEGYLQSAQDLGRVTVLEPRALALARAVGLPDSTVVEWADDRLQVTQVQDRLVHYTTSVAVHNGAGSSSSQLLRLLTGLMPTVGGRRPQLTSVVLLGKLYGREDIEQAFREAGGDEGAHQTGWQLPEPYQAFAGTSQMANVGLLMRS
jgi:Tfp pilus assembly PilM family ATPase